MSAPQPIPEVLWRARWRWRLARQVRNRELEVGAASIPHSEAQR